jgi:Fe-S oxidoreductase
VLEPSCFAVFRDEAINLYPNRPEVRALSRQAVLFDEFVSPLIEKRRSLKVGRELIVHGHCHQKALTGIDKTMQVLDAVDGRATVIDSGCCGMAGAFGFDRDHYNVSIQVGERVLLPAVRRAPSDTIIVADGFSCREQIAQVADRKALHLAEVLALALQHHT